MLTMVLHVTFHNEWFFMRSIIDECDCASDDMKGQPRPLPLVTDLGLVSSLQLQLRMRARKALVRCG